MWGDRRSAWSHPKSAQGGSRSAQSKTPPVQIPAASHLRHSAKTRQSPAPKPSNLHPAKPGFCSQNPWTKRHRSSRTQAVGSLHPGQPRQSVRAANASCPAFPFSISTILRQPLAQAPSFWQAGMSCDEWHCLRLGARPVPAWV